MVDKNIQIKDLEGASLYPRTKSKVVLNSKGQSIGDVEPNAQVNKIEKIQVNGVDVAILNKTANIPISSASTYSIAKAQTPAQGYSATYNLTKDGVNVGEAINIPKDMVVESGEVKVCEKVNTPVQGYQVGDRYIDLLLANAANQHIYILVSDLVDNYEAGSNINIVGRTISVNIDGLKQTFAIKSEVPTKTSQLQNDSGFLTKHQDISGKADKATTLAGYGITNAYTKTEISNMNLLTYDELI